MAAERLSRDAIFRNRPSPHHWPRVPQTIVPQAQREQFNALVQAITLYYDGVPLEEIGQTTGTNPKAVCYFAKRCVALRPDGEIYGFAALLRSTRMKPYTREAPIRAKRENEKAGMAGALSALLDRFPDIQDKLVARIHARAKELRVQEFRLRPKDLHKIFIDLVRGKGVKATEWPFNTQYRGARSISSYMQSILAQNFALTVRTREEQSAHAHLAVGSGERSLLYFNELLHCVELDAHHIDAHLTVVFRTPEGLETEVRLSRLWLLALIERRSTSVLAYSVVYRTEINADDILRVIRMALDPEPRLPALTIPGLQYPPHSGLPAQVYPALRGAAWDVLFLDRALAHLSLAVRERARQQVGFMLNWGPVAHFERRPNVERFFLGLEEDVFHRLPSTTGSNPHRRRAKEAERQAMKLRIRAEDAEQQIAAYILRHNITPTEGRSFLTPLEVIGQSLEASKQHFLPRTLPGAASQRPALLTVSEVHTVRGGYKSGRYPYVQIDRVHYTSPALRAASGLIGKKLFIDIDEEDMRQVSATLPNGKSLGILTAVGRWGRTKHDRRTRKAINSLLARRIIVLTDGQDPVLVYQAWLSETQARVPRAAHDVPKPKRATDAARVAAMTGHPLTLVPPEHPPAPVSDNVISLPNAASPVASMPAAAASRLLGDTPLNVRDLLNRRKR